MPDETANAPEGPQPQPSTPEKRPVLLSKTEREPSLLALHGIRMGLSGTARAFMLMQGRPSNAGEVLSIRKEDAIRIVQSAFVVSDFAAEMVRQLKWLEEKTGVKAEPQDQKVPGGLVLPAGTVDLVIEDESLLAVVEKPSSLVPSQMIQDKVLVAKVGDKLPVAPGEAAPEGEEALVTMADLREVLDEWRKAHP